MCGQRLHHLSVFVISKCFADRRVWHKDENTFSDFGKTIFWIVVMAVLPFIQTMYYQLVLLSLFNNDDGFTMRYYDRKITLAPDINMNHNQIFTPTSSNK